MQRTTRNLGYEPEEIIDLPLIDFVHPDDRDAVLSDLRALQADFALEGAPERDGLQWVKATPKSKDGQLQSVQIGFQGDALAALEILDSFGQRSVLKFGKVEVNPSLPGSTFVFKPPPGADVVRQ